MTALILGLTALLFVLLIWEDRQVRRDRERLTHVIYVNGIRGKSTVTRLIDGGLRAGGWSVFCKTTGSVPMVIGTDNVERPLFRRGRANIREQVRMVRRAVREGAQILVIECMAVAPALQAVSQDRMVRADIGVITNVRLDHTEEMGPTLEEICDSLCSTLPRGGVLYTADEKFVDRIRRNGRARECRVELARPDGRLPALDFPENVALALAVCQRVGVDRETALAGMARYHPDPYVLSAYRLPGGGAFVNAMTANDPQSTQLIYRRVAALPAYRDRKLILLINNRPDRGYRTEHMLLVAQALPAGEIWLTGAAQQAVRGKLRRRLPDTPVRLFPRAEQLPLDGVGPDALVFAVGNIAGPGKRLMELVKEVGTPDVL